MFSEFVPLVFYKRDEITEVTIFGSVLVWSGDKPVFSLGGNPLLYGRSLLKPYQMKPIAADLRDLAPRARALTVASHNAEPMHLEAQKEIGTFTLQLPESAPLTRPWLARAQANHPCTGKHSAILRASRKHGWPEETYLSQGHPYHEAFVRSLQLVLGSRWAPVRTAVDGCGLPAPSFSLSELAHLYENLSARRDDDWIWSAMTTYPEMVGGDNRLDTEIMRANAGDVVAKEGADGLLGLSFAIDGLSFGVAIKIAHGHDPRASGAVAELILKRYGFNAPVATAPHGQTLELAPELR